MRPFRVKTDVIAGDRASRVFKTITASSRSMASGIVRQTKIAAIAMNNFNARVNQVGRNIGKRLGGLGKLGLGIGFLAIATTIIDANVELDASFASLSAITGKTGAEFDAFKGQVAAVGKEQKLFAGDVAKGFEIVASAKPELLANADALGRVTNAAITLSKASGDDLAKSSLSLTGVMNQFNLEASQAERVMNALAAGSVYGSANITNVAASMKNFGAVASGANITMEQSVALVEVMGSKSIFAEEAGTKLRGSILKLQQAGIGYASGQFKINDALDEAKLKFDKLGTSQKKDAFLLKTFGAENITTGQILLKNIGMFEKMTKSVTGTSTATEQAAIKANTFQNRLKEITASFKNSITATEEQGSQMQSLKDIMAFVAENMDTIIAGIVIALKIFAAYKAIMLVVNVVTWAFNAALLANPITWIIIGIVALIAAIAALIIYWEDIVKWVKESDNVFAKIIRAAILPLIIAFKLLGIIIDWISEKWNEFVNYLATSDDTFVRTAKAFVSAMSQIGDVLSYIWDLIVQFVEFAIQPMIDAFDKLGQVIDFFSSETQKELGVDINKNLTFEQRGINEKNLTPEQRGISSKTELEVTKDKSSDALIKSLNLNSDELDKNTKSAQKQWTGKFSTSILKDVNVQDRTSEVAQKEISTKDRTSEVVQKELINSSVLKDISSTSTNTIQKELAISAMNGEINNSSIQNEIINNTNSRNVVTKSSSSSKKSNNTTNGNITINVVDKTGGKFGLTVESTGVNLVTTGNS